MGLHTWVFDSKLLWALLVPQSRSCAWLTVGTSAYHMSRMASIVEAGVWKVAQTLWVPGRGGFWVSAVQVPGSGLRQNCRAEILANGKCSVGGGPPSTVRTVTLLVPPHA